MLINFDIDMTWLKKYRKQENLFYLIVWSVVLLAPAIVIQVNVLTDITRNNAWGDVLVYWNIVLPYMILFLIHNYGIIPFSSKLKSVWVYIFLCLLAIALFGVIQSERNASNIITLFGIKFIGAEILYHFPSGLIGKQIPNSTITPAMVSTSLAFIMMVLNISIKELFKRLSDSEKLEKLEKENIEQQMEYLRYQINPHLLMNTLNNIHALVDIDKDLAKTSIVELSKLLRFILYEGSKPTIALSKEIDFLKQYISLMKMRYSDSVEIALNLPEDTDDVEVPPLVFVTFVENAFKHGISYSNESFIRVCLLKNSGRLVFRCSNSMNVSNQDTQSGIGLPNVKKKLELIYGKDFILEQKETDGVYSVFLNIPMTPSD